MDQKGSPPDLNECAAFIQESQSYFKNMPIRPEQSDLQTKIFQFDKLERYLSDVLPEDSKYSICSDLTTVKRKIKAMSGSIPDSEHRDPKMLERLFEIGEEQVAPLLSKIALDLKNSGTLYGLNLILGEILHKVIS